MFSAPKGCNEKMTDENQHTGLPTLLDGVYAKFCPSPHVQFLDGNTAGRAGLPGPL